MIEVVLNSIRRPSVGYFVSMIERGQRVPHVETLADISEALGATLSDLFLEENEPRGGQTPELPFLAYLGTRSLDRKDVEKLLGVARALFDDDRPYLTGAD